MVRLMTTTMLATAGILLSPMAANAGLTNSAKNSEVQPQTKISIIEKDNTKVLAAQATSEASGMIPVVDDNGRLFYNKVVSSEELPKVDHDLNVLDTYTFKHNGRVYTNKVVANKA